MSKFKEYLEANEPVSKTKGKGISDKDLKILEDLSKNKENFKEYLKEGRLPNSIGINKNGAENLPSISIYFESKVFPAKYETQYLDDINGSSFHLTSKKDIDELISILTKLKKLECIK
jgi:hypothetical protein